MEEISADMMDDVLAQKQIAVIKFFATWCGPCNMLKPVFERVTDNNDDVAFGEVNADKHPGLLAKYGVQGLPTVVVFKEGQEYNRVVGMKQTARYQEVIDAAKGILRPPETLT